MANDGISKLEVLKLVAEQTEQLHTDIGNAEHRLRNSINSAVRSLGDELKNTISATRVDDSKTEDLVYLIEIMKQNDEARKLMFRAASNL